MVFDIVHLIFSSLSFSLYSSSWWKTRPHVSLSRYAIKIYKKRLTRKSAPAGFITIGLYQLCCGLDTLPNIFNIKCIIRNWSGRLLEVLVFPKGKYQGFSWWTLTCILPKMHSEPDRNFFFILQFQEVIMNGVSGLRVQWLAEVVIK